MKDSVRTLKKWPKEITNRRKVKWKEGDKELCG